MTRLSLIMLMVSGLIVVMSDTPYNALEVFTLACIADGSFIHASTITAHTNKQAIVDNAGGFVVVDV